MKNKKCSFNSDQHVLVIGKLPDQDKGETLDSLSIFKDFYRGLNSLSYVEATVYNGMSCLEIINSLQCDMVAFLSYYDSSKLINYVASDFFTEWLSVHIAKKNEIDSFYKVVIASRYEDLSEIQKKENKLFFKYFLGG